MQLTEEDRNKLDILYLTIKNNTALPLNTVEASNLIVSTLKEHGYALIPIKSIGVEYGIRTWAGGVSNIYWCEYFSLEKIIAQLDVWTGFDKVEIVYRNVSNVVTPVPQRLLDKAAQE